MVTNTFTDNGVMDGKTVGKGSNGREALYVAASKESEFSSSCLRAL